MLLKSKKRLNDRSTDERRLFKNFLYLFCFQASNYLMPLFAIPLMTRILTVEEFGAVMVVMALIQFCYVVTDFGFNFSATLSVSENRGCKEKLDVIISRVNTTKFFLIPLTFFFVFGASFFQELEGYRSFLVISVLSIIFQAYQPNWFFHGLEKMALFSLYMSLSRISFVIMVYIFLPVIGAGEVVLFSWAFANFLGFMAGFLIMKKLGYRNKFSSFRDALVEARNSLPFFWARFSVALYTSFSSIIVGYKGLHEAALYAGAENFYKAGQSATRPISQALFPYMVNKKNKKLFFLVFVFTFIFLMLCCSAVYYFSDHLILFLYGDSYLEMGSVLLVFMLMVPVNYVSVIYGYPACAIFDRQDIANTSVVVGALFFLVIVFFLFLYDAVSALSVSLSVLVVEMFVMFYRVLAIYAESARTRVA